MLKRPKNRADLKAHLAEFRRRILGKSDPTLSSIGYTTAGLQYYFQTACNAAPGQSEMLALAAAELATRYNA